MAPLVSVILCTYNQAAFLRDAIESVMTQTYPEIELIVIDNGSQDDSARIIAEYASRPGVRPLIHTENDHVTKRLNGAVALSRGAFVSFLFGDDYYLPEKIERQVARFQTLGPEYAVVYGPGYRLEVDTGERWLLTGFSASGMVGRELLLSYHLASINPIAPLFRRQVLTEHPLHEDLFLESTESLLMRLSLYHPFSYLDDPLVVMRSHSGNAAKAYAWNTENNLVILDRIAREPGFPADIRARWIGIKAQSLRHLAWLSLRLRRNQREARGYLRRAIAMDSRELLSPRTIAALFLSVLPRPVLDLVNAAVKRRHGHARNLEFKDDIS